METSERRRFDPSFLSLSGTLRLQPRLFKNFSLFCVYLYVQIAMEWQALYFIRKYSSNMKEIVFFMFMNEFLHIKMDTKIFLFNFKRTLLGISY